MNDDEIEGFRRSLDIYYDNTAPSGPLEHQICVMIQSYKDMDSSTYRDRVLGGIVALRLLCWRNDIDVEELEWTMD